MSAAPTERQRDILRHTLGIREGRSLRGWRNHFVTGPGSDDFDDCESLVAMGLMTKRPGHALTGGDPIYHATEAGVKAAEAVGAPT